ncbi:MAG: hypothetical protein ACFFAK_02120 [Promethearchaeota archaeon]
MVIKEHRWIWTNRKYTIVHTPTIYWIIAMILIYVGFTPITSCF